MDTVIYKCPSCGADVEIKNIDNCTCDFCGAKINLSDSDKKKFKKKKKSRKPVNKKKVFKVIFPLLVLLVLGVLIFTHTICLFHSFSEATVLKPQTCHYCDKTIGDPKPLSEIKFPQNGLAALLPVPKSNIGEIDNDSSTYIEIYVGEMSLDDFNKYVDGCSDKGFNVDYTRYNSSSFGYEYYHAEDINGNSLELRYYENLGIMEIRVYAP